MEEKEVVPGKKIGRGMLHLMWIGVLIGLTFVFGVWEEQQYNPNSKLEGSKNGTSQTVVLKRNVMGHYVASGLINGVPVVYLLDTGASSVAIPQNLAAKLGLRPGARYMVSTANGNVEVRGTTIDKLELGPIVVHNVQAAINPGMQGEEILLGMSVLKNLDFYQSGKQLTITQHF